MFKLFIYVNIKYKTLLLLLFLFNNFFCQKRKSIFSASIEVGLSPKSINIIDSGNVNPPQRNPRQLSINLNWEYKPLNKKINLGLNIKNTVVKTSFGWAYFNDIDKTIYLPITGKNFEKNVFTFQLMKLMVSGVVNYKLIENEKRKVSISVMPSLTLYYPMVQEYWFGSPTNQSTLITPFGLLKVIEGYEYVVNSRDAKVNFKVRPEISLMGSYILKLKNKRQFAIDLTSHFAPSKLYSEYVTFYPELPQFRAKIHYSLNNSYNSIAVRYFFIKKNK